VSALLAAVALVGPAPAPVGARPAPRATRAHVAVALPADLVALAQKMEGLSLSSERFRLRTAISALAGAHVPRDELRLLALFDIDLSGEATSSPPSGSFRLTILGHTLTLRVVGRTSYLYEPALARRDGGRPWIRLGRSGLGSLFGAGALAPVPASGNGHSFSRLAGLLRHAVSVRELGPGTVDGQAITGFRMALDESALQEGGSARPSAPRPITERIGLAAAAQPSPAITLEIMIAPSGLPVQTRVEVASEGLSFGALDDLYAVNFPLSVRAPPKRRTIGLAALRRLGQRRRGAPPEAREDARRRK
jgi:hypothetical protein